MNNYVSRLQDTLSSVVEAVNMHLSSLRGTESILSFLAQLGRVAVGFTFNSPNSPKQVCLNPGT